MKAHVIRSGADDVSVFGCSVATANVVDETDVPGERFELHSCRFKDGTIQVSVKVRGVKEFHAVFEDRELVKAFALSLTDLVDGRTTEEIMAAGRKALSK